jgi:acetyl-CoA synthetase
VPDPVKGSALVVMVVPADAGADPAELSAAVDAALDVALGRVMRPSAFHLVRALPYTRTAKLMRRAIRAVYVGNDPGDLSGMDNSDGLEAVAAVKPSA